MIDLNNDRRRSVSAGNGSVPIKAWVEGVPLEDEAITQLRNVARLPVVGPHVAVMPDVHYGVGATVGSVIPTRGAIIPAAVGVDIGCGMVAVKTNLRASDLPDSLAAMRSAIEAAVPHGRTNNGGPGDRGAWHDPPQDVEHAWMSYANGDVETALKCRFDAIVAGHAGAKAHNTVAHLGTLGGGNHFVEVCLGEDAPQWCGTCDSVHSLPFPERHDGGCNRRPNPAVWVMLHSGSRGPGNRIGSYFIELAKNDMRTAHGKLPEDEDLAYLVEGTEHFDDYVRAVTWAQDFARTNREIMLRSVLGAINMSLDVRSPGYGELRIVDAAINCHHNYVQKERHFGEDVWLTRKGAVSARAGELGIIPGSMGAKSFIVRGLGNADSFHSCSHGAGRKMSRGAAKRTFTLEDHAAATAGVECRKDADVIDETPGAYKSIDDVMHAQRDLVEVVTTLRQVLCVKG